MARMRPCSISIGAIFCGILLLSMAGCRGLPPNLDERVNIAAQEIIHSLPSDYTTYFFWQPHRDTELQEVFFTLYNIDFEVRPFLQYTVAIGGAYRAAQPSPQFVSAPQELVVAIAGEWPTAIAAELLSADDAWSEEYDEDASFSYWKRRDADMQLLFRNEKLAYITNSELPEIIDWMEYRGSGGLPKRVVEELPRHIFTFYVADFASFLDVELPVAIPSDTLHSFVVWGDRVDISGDDEADFVTLAAEDAAVCYHISGWIILNSARTARAFNGIFRLLLLPTLNLLAEEGEQFGLPLLEKFETVRYGNRIQFSGVCLDSDRLLKLAQLTGQIEGL